MIQRAVLTAAATAVAAAAAAAPGVAAVAIAVPRATKRTLTRCPAVARDVRRPFSSATLTTRVLIWRRGGPGGTWTKLPKARMKMASSRTAAATWNLGGALCLADIGPRQVSIAGQRRVAAVTWNAGGARSPAATGPWRVAIAGQGMCCGWAGCPAPWTLAA